MRLDLLQEPDTPRECIHSKMRMELKLDRARFDRCIVRWIKQVQAKQQVGQRLNSKKLIDNGIHNKLCSLCLNLMLECDVYEASVTDPI